MPVSRLGRGLLATFVSAAIALGYWRLFYGVDFTDEAWYVAVPYRFVLGGTPYVDELSVPQTTAGASSSTPSCCGPHHALAGRDWPRALRPPPPLGRRSTPPAAGTARRSPSRLRKTAPATWRSRCSPADRRLQLRAVRDPERELRQPQGAACSPRGHAARLARARRAPEYACRWAALCLGLAPRSPIPRSCSPSAVELLRLPGSSSRATTAGGGGLLERGAARARDVPAGRRLRGARCGARRAPPARIVSDYRRSSLPPRPGGRPR